MKGNKTFCLDEDVYKLIEDQKRFHRSRFVNNAIRFYANENPLPDFNSVISWASKDTKNYADLVLFLKKCIRWIDE